MKRDFNLIAIAACNQDRIIGFKQKIPWHSPKDLNFFKKITDQSICWMGKNTLLSLPKVLSHRIHIVLTKDATPIINSNWYQNQCKFYDLSYIHKHVLFASNIEEAKELTLNLFKKYTLYASKPVFCIGGAHLYQQLLPECSWTILTWVETKKIINGDTYFPDITHSSQWKLIASHPDYDPKAQLNLTFNLYKNSNRNFDFDESNVLHLFESAIHLII